MSIECTCCTTFECGRRQHIQETIEMVPFRLDPVSKEKFVKDCKVRVYADCHYSTQTFNALYYSYTALWG